MKFTRNRAIGTLSLSKEEKKLKMSFVADGLSTFGGLPLLEKISKVTGFFKGVESKLTDHRTRSLITYNKLRLLRQCVLLTATGNADLNDADKLRHDPAYAKVLGKAEDGRNQLASEPTMARFFNDMTLQELDDLEDWLVEFYLQNHRVMPRQIYLYFDGTAVQTYGKQEGATYRGGTYSKEMLFPLTVYDQNGWLLCAKLRAGYETEAKTILDVLEPLVGKLRSRWRKVEIVLVVDGGFKSPSLLNWCEANKVDYLAGYTASHAIRAKVKVETKKLEAQFKRKFGLPRYFGEGGKKKFQKEHVRVRMIEDSKLRMEAEKEASSRMVRMVVEDSHRAATWDKQDPERRVIIRVDYTDRGPDIRCLLTSFKSYSAERIYEIYRQRGTSERWIGELKNSLRFNSQSFKANQLRLLIHGFAYQLLWLLRSMCSKAFQNQTIVSIRKMFVEIPVAISIGKRFTNWALASHYPYQTEFLRITRKLELRSH